MTNIKQPGKFLAILAVIAGIFLLICGLLASLNYLGGPFLFSGNDPLTLQLGQMAAIFLGILGGGLSLIHGAGSLLKRRSQPLRLPSFYLFWILFAIALGLGNLLINYHIGVQFLFPITFALGASLPTISVLAYALRRLGYPLTWRQGSLAFVSGSTLSILVAILLSTALSYIIFLLIEPLGYMFFDFLGIMDSGGSGLLEQIFLSPMILFFLAITALQAPIPEEFAKALGPALFGRRIQSERQAFALGLSSGAGFAILENMLYEGIYAQWSGWSWGGVTLLRAIGTALHPICTAIIVLAIFRERERESGWFRRLGLAYLLSAGIHTLWNGGFQSFVFLTGVGYYGRTGPSLSLYDLYVEVALVVFLLILSSGLWWLLRRYTKLLGEGDELDFAPRLVSPRALAGWAVACALVIIPIGAALGPAWSQIKSILLP